jgi:hypothetical protein
MGDTAQGWQDHPAHHHDEGASSASARRAAPIDPNEYTPLRLLITAWRLPDASGSGMTRTTRRLLIVCILMGVLVPTAIVVSVLGLHATGDDGLADDVFESLIFMLPFILPPVALLIGFNLIFSSRKRVGDAVHCAKCEYLLSPDPDAYEYCPECGSNVTQHGATLHGTRRHRPARIWAGGALLVVSISFFPATFNLVNVTPYMPTGFLSWYATRWQPGFSRAAWSELAIRPLTAEQREDIAGRLIDLRTRRWLDLPAMQWLDAEVAQAAISDKLIERYYADAYRFRLNMPTEVDRGERLTLQIVSDVNEPAWLGLRPYLVYDELVVNGEVAPPPDRTKARVLLGMNPDRSGLMPAYCYTGFWYDTSHECWPSGTYDFEVSFWIMYLPTQGGGYEIDWNEDGTPILPDGCEWAKRYTLHGSTRIVGPD